MRTVYVNVTKAGPSRSCAHAVICGRAGTPVQGEKTSQPSLCLSLNLLKACPLLMPSYILLIIFLSRQVPRRLHT